jgi:hypothetical protein
MLGVVGEDDRPEPAVVIFRNAADEPYRIVVHYSLRSLLMTASTWASRHGGSKRPRVLLFSGTLPHCNRSGMGKPASRVARNGC